MAIFQYLPIRIVETWNSTRIYKNTHISGSTNATETCQTILGGRQLTSEEKVGGPPLEACRRKGVINFSQVINSHQSLDSQSMLD